MMTTKTFFSLDGELKVACKHLFEGETEEITSDGLIPLREGVLQCTYFYENKELGQLPSWVNRGSHSYPIRFPDDCRNCPVYCPDPVQNRIFEENKSKSRK